MTTDPAFQPVVYPDDFRRAKRNSLAWSGITFLAVIGMHSGTAPPQCAAPGASYAAVPVSLFQTGLCYYKWQLVFVGLSISTFMLLGFVRANRVLRRINSPLFLRGKMIDVTAALDKVSEEAASALAAAKGLQRYADTMRADLAKSISRAAAKASSYAGEINHMLPASAESLNFHPMPGGDKPDPEIVLRDLKQCASGVQLTLTTLGSELETTRNNFEQEIGHLAESREAAVETLDRLAAVSKQLVGWHADIDRSEQAWWKYYDVGIVGVLYALAAISSIVYLAPLVLALTPSLGLGSWFQDTPN